VQKNITPILVLGILIVGGCAGPKLVGTFDGKTYTSAEKDYSVRIPVTGMGGHIAGDDERGVTFRDDMGMRVGFYSLKFKPGSQFQSTLQSAGHEQALDHYLKLLYHGVETMNYHADIRDGTMSFIFAKDPGIKTSAAAFIHSNRVYLVEFDLPAATKALWHGTEQEQNRWLEGKAVEILQTIQTR